jgi:5-(carboxyamino)imidazole ribonucleotide synthase
LRFSNVGIVGAGQLGRMMALAGYPLGIRCSFLDTSPEAPAGQVAPILVGPLEDRGLLEKLASQSDVLTFDWENIAGRALAPLERLTQVRPPRAALEASQDRLHEKDLFKRLRIPVAAHAAVDARPDLERAALELGVPGILKTRRLGYDGKGQFVIDRREQIEEAWNAMGAEGLIYEKFQVFSRELSIVGARSGTGEIVSYPLSANTHADGILRYGLAPFASLSLERSAKIYLKRVMSALDYVGVLAIEFFVVNGRLVANEMAPRVHNSGHWTIEGCVTSQFENHLRAICNLPLGSTRALGHTAMINFLGEMPDRERLLKLEGLAFHDYGKAPRPGRKLGHCTVLRARPADRDRALKVALKLIKWS